MERFRVMGGGSAGAVVLSVIVPTLNEGAAIEATLAHLQGGRRTGRQCLEIIVVDGGSTDDTLLRAQPFVDQWLPSEPGRARQMNAGAAVARGEYVLFLHADTELPSLFVCKLTEYVAKWREQRIDWGFFPLHLSGQRWPLRVIERAINLRSRLTAVSTGDQCQFVRRALFERLGGFPEVPLMEDVALSKLLRRRSSPLVADQPASTSSRRWEQNGIAKTVVLMWSLRLAYFLGVSPVRLAAIYYPRRQSRGEHS